MLSADGSHLVVLCRDAAPSDLQYLTDENIDEIGMRCRRLPLSSASCNALLCGAGKAMTHIEKMRLQAAMQALRGATPKQTVVLATSDLTV